MKKYKCRNCGHIFDGDSSFNCPGCGSDNLEIVKNVWKKPLIVVGVILAIYILWLIRPKSDPRFNLILKDDFPTIGKISLEVESDDISEKELKKYYVNENGLGLREFNGKYKYVTYDKNSMQGGEIYVFEFIEKKTKKMLDKRVYNCPMPPTPPKIKVNSTADCNTGTYTIEIEVEDGNPDVYYLDDKEYTSNTITEVQPKRGVYTIKAYDSVNKLYSEEHRITCSHNGVLSYSLSSDKIQQAFRDISQRKIYVGDAMLKITGNGKNIQLSRSIDGCRTLEEALNYARTHEILYQVDVEIDSDGCFDRITRITLSK